MRIPMAVLYLPRVMLTKANFAFNETPIAFRAHVGDTVLFLCSFFLLFFFFHPLFCFISSYLVSRKKIPSVFFSNIFFYFIDRPTPPPCHFFCTPNFLSFQFCLIASIYTDLCFFFFLF